MTTTNDTFKPLLNADDLAITPIIEALREVFAEPTKASPEPDGLPANIGDMFAETIRQADANAPLDLTKFLID